MGKHFAWWPSEGEGEAYFSLFFIFPFNKFYSNFFFSLILRFYFTMVLDCYFMAFFFPWFINYSHASWCTKSSTHLSPNWFWSNFLNFTWIHGVAHDHVLWASSRTSEWRITSEVIPKFDIDPSPSWWKFRTMKGAPSFWSWTLSNLVLSHFFEFSYHGDFVTGQPRFWWWTWNCLLRFLWN